jgi:hypothetical protein
MLVMAVPAELVSNWMADFFYPMISKKLAKSTQPKIAHTQG